MLSTVDFYRRVPKDLTEVCLFESGVYRVRVAFTKILRRLYEDLYGANENHAKNMHANIVFFSLFRYRPRHWVPPCLFVPWASWPFSSFRKPLRLPVPRWPPPLRWTKTPNRRYGSTLTLPCSICIAIMSVSMCGTPSGRTVKT